MKSIKIKIVFSVVGLLIVAQFFKGNHEVPDTKASSDFIAYVQPPVHVETILKNACYDCHSYETVYPWYGNIAPLSWWTDHHVEEGREELNFSVWSEYSVKKKLHKLEEVVEMVEEGEMPMYTYLWMHPEADFTDEELASFMEWVNKYRKSGNVK